MVRILGVLLSLSSLLSTKSTGANYLEKARQLLNVSALVDAHNDLPEKISNIFKQVFCKESGFTATHLNFFKDGKIIWDKEQIAPLGAYWESLHPKNRWGGNFKSLVDCPHFERNVG
jgi:hypothetical protein